MVANKGKPNLLSKDSLDVKVSNITPVVGTEIRGLQLSKLDNKQKDELALLIGERGVVVFRDQDFKDIGIEKQKEFGEYFGPLHIHVRNNRCVMNIHRVADVSCCSQLELMSRAIWSFTTFTSGQTMNTATRANVISSRASAFTLTSLMSASLRG